MNKIKYIFRNKYILSTLRLSGDFIEEIKKESSERQIVQINGTNVVFGLEGPIISKSGKFWSISAKVENGKWGKHYILISPNLKDIIQRGECFIRLDSGCLSAVLGDISCDCLEQLRIAQEISIKKGGVVIHIPNQDGRGWQVDYKMANQRIMHETNLDTISVAKRFYGSEDKIDVRTFEESALILKALGFPKGYKFNLGTKNPKKVNTLSKAGFIVSTIPIEVDDINPFLVKNLKAKERFFKTNKKEKSYATN